MPVLLSNVRFDTLRGSYNPVTQQTSGASPYLSGVDAHAVPTSSQQLAVLPEAAFGTEYSFTVDTGVKIAEGDLITNITRSDGITPWPNDVIAPGNANAPLIVWRVKLILEESPGLLAYRKVFVVRDRLSGPAGN